MAMVAWTVAEWVVTALLAVVVATVVRLADLGHAGGRRVVFEVATTAVWKAVTQAARSVAARVVRGEVTLAARTAAISAVLRAGQVEVLVVWAVEMRAGLMAATTVAMTVAATAVATVAAMVEGDTQEAARAVVGWEEVARAGCNPLKGPQQSWARLPCIDP